MKQEVLQRIALAALVAACALPAAAQQAEAITLRSVPPDLIEEDASGQPVAQQQAAPIDLGQEDIDGSAADAAAAAAVEAEAEAAQPAAVGAATRAAQEAKAKLRQQTRRPPQVAGRVGVERAVFERQPVRVPLPVGRERLITLPAPAALHVPTDMQQVARIEVIDKTIYATALVPFTPIRIVAELIDSGQQVPLDLVAGPQTSGALSELEVSVVTWEEAGAAQAAAGAEDDDAAPDRSPTSQHKGVDMIDLTRHAARMLYAPRRLAWAHPGVSQVRVDTSPLPRLLRGVDVDAVPVGGWHSGRLSVTAIRVTNKSKYPLEIPLESIRGRWIAATAQHGRIGAAGSDTDTTAIYLVCDRAFEACLE